MRDHIERVRGPWRATPSLAPRPLSTLLMGALALGLLALGLLALGGLGCAAKKDQFADHDWEKEPLPEQTNLREVQSMFNDAESDADLGNHTLRGVRLDLSMADSAKPDVRCSCIDAVVGGSRDSSKFSWAGEKPVLSSSHMLFAFRTAGSQCPAGVPAIRRPSIQAVDTKGRDVIVVIEELPPDRPQALGAIVRRPSPGGALYIRPRTYRKVKLPYARSSGQRMCRAYRSPGGLDTPLSGPGSLNNSRDNDTRDPPDLESGW